MLRHAFFFLSKFIWISAGWSFGMDIMKSASRKGQEREMTGLGTIINSLAILAGRLFGKE